MQTINKETVTFDPTRYMVVPIAATKGMVEAVFVGKVETQDCFGQARRRAEVVNTWKEMVASIPRELEGVERCDSSTINRTKLFPMVNDDGSINQWYFACEGHYIDVVKDEQGTYSIFFRDRKSGGEGWADQAEQVEGLQVRIVELERQLQEFCQRKVEAFALKNDDGIFDVYFTRREAQMASLPHHTIVPLCASDKTHIVDVNAVVAQQLRYALNSLHRISNGEKDPVEHARIAIKHITCGAYVPMISVDSMAEEIAVKGKRIVELEARVQVLTKIVGNS